MPRRRRKSSYTQPPRNFVHAMPSAIATGLPVLDFAYTPRGPVDLLQVEDRRRWEPHRYYSAPRSTRGAGTIVQAGPSRAAARAGRFDPFAVTKLNFSRPQNLHLAICIRRKRRRQVLLAKGYGGRNRKPRLKSYSHVRC